MELRVAAPPRPLQMGAAFHGLIVAMTEFTPNGYISIREALNQVGRRLFHGDWTGEEHKAPRGLLSTADWLKIKDVPRARGSGARGSPGIYAPRVAPNQTKLPSDPSDPLYQEEYKAGQRYAAAREELRKMLEVGVLEAALWDRWTGKLHRSPADLWRRHDAGELIEKGCAPLPGSPNTGSVIVKQFADEKPITLLPAAKLPELVKALQEATAAETLTRAEQKDMLRQRFPKYRITERQIRQVFQHVPVPEGRPKKSDA